MFPKQRDIHVAQLRKIRNLERTMFLIIGEALNGAYMRSEDKDIDLGNVPFSFTVDGPRYTLNGGLVKERSRSPSKSPSKSPAKSSSRSSRSPENGWFTTPVKRQVRCKL